LFENFGNHKKISAEERGSHMRSAMFNDKQKQEYIDFEATNEGALKRYFVRIAPKEDEYSKDIIEMKLDEALDSLKSLKIRREESRGHLLSLLRGYRNWAFTNGKTKNKDVIGIITPESIGTDDAVKESMIGSPEHLQLIFDDPLDYEYYENKSKMSELLLRLLYEGMTLEEIRALKKTDISGANMIKTIHSAEFIVSDDIARLWKQCAEMDHYEKKNGRSTFSNKKDVNEYTQYALVESVYLFRTIASSKSYPNTMMTLDSLRKIILAVFSACEKKTIPARNINYSGIFYKFLQTERAGKAVTPDTIAQYFRIPYNEQSNLHTMTRKWRIDYEDWKIAFGYMQTQVPERNPAAKPVLP